MLIMYVNQYDQESNLIVSNEEKYMLGDEMRSDTPIPCNCGTDCADRSVLFESPITKGHEED